MNKNIKKVMKHPLFLYIVPTFVFFYYFLSFYNNNFTRNNGEILFYEIIIIYLISFFIYICFYILFRKIFFDDKDKRFLACCLSSCLFCFCNVYVVLLIGCILIVLKFFIKFRLDYIAFFASFFIVFLFSFQLIQSGYYFIYHSIYSVSYDNDRKINIDSNTDSPNIYWIHSDAMIGMDVMEKYFDYDNKKLKKYFYRNGYVYNENARLVAGHSTKKALPALFNPYYYDHYYKQYVLDLENVFLEKKVLPDVLFDYYELRDKRLNNELFQSLKKKDYTTYAIGSFDQHTSLYTDYYYNYSNLGYEAHNFDGELEVMDYSSNKNIYLPYIQLMHLETLVSRSYLSRLIHLDHISILKNKKLDYRDMDLSNYAYADSTKYVPVKVILKCLDDIMKSDKSKFVFVDFYLNHLPLNYDSLGNRLYGEQQYDLSYYIGNYVYSVNLLVDMMQYIHDHDKNAIIIVQADHGLNMGDDEVIMNLLHISNEEVQDVRNSVINAVYIPDSLRKGDEDVLKEPLNISRYLVNHYVGYNYEYIK